MAAKIEEIWRDNLLRVVDALIAEGKSARDAYREVAARTRHAVNDEYVYQLYTGHRLSMSAEKAEAIGRAFADGRSESWFNLPFGEHGHLLVRRTVPIPRFRIVELPLDALPEKFEVEIDDDALAPDFLRGGIARFSTSREVVPGRPVLVMDKDGTRYIRLYRQRTPTHWTAASLNPAYESLDAVRDGLRVLAVMVGYDWPQ